MRTLVSFGVGEAVYWGLRSQFGLSGDPAMLNGLAAGAALWMFFPWRRLVSRPAPWPEVEAAETVPALPPASAVPMPDMVSGRAPATVAARDGGYEAVRAPATSTAQPASRPPSRWAPGSGRSAPPKKRALADEVGDLLEEARVHMLDLRLAADRVEASRIKTDLETICETAGRLIERLGEGDRPRLLYASRIESTLATTHEVVASYLDMESGKIFVEEQRKAKIRGTVESEFLPTIADAFQHFARKLDEPAVIDLEAAIKAMTTRLQMEGL